MIPLKLLPLVISRIEGQFCTGFFLQISTDPKVSNYAMMILPSVHMQLFLDCTTMRMRLVSLIVGIILSRSDVRIGLFYSNITIKYLIISFSSNKSGSGKKRKYKLEDWQCIEDFYRL